MSAHVRPHRWADAAAGRVPADERARMGAHAATCARCAAGRDRVTGSREAFGEIARAQAPELRWEQVGARVYWAASQERRTRARTATHPSRRRWLWLVPAVAAAGGLAAFLVLRDDAAPKPAPIAAEQPKVELPRDITPIELVDTPTALTGLVTLAQGDVVGASGPVFTTPVVAGSSLETGAGGRLAIQLDAGTAFALGAESRLVVSRLDSSAIELHLDGEISVEVAHRAPDQRFTVIAGGRVVEVRGTAFEVVHRDGAVEVACRHGLVSVRDVLASSTAPIEVAAGKRWTALDGGALTMDTLAPLDDAAIAALTGRAPALLPAWGETTGPLEVHAAPGRPIRVDGVVIGSGPLIVRVMPGRHLVESDKTPGQWIEAGGKVDVPDAPPAQPSKKAGVATRRKQLETAVDDRRLANCVRDLARQGLSEGTYVVLSIGVDATGAISYLNVGDTDLPSANASCVRDLVAEVAFPAGPPATWKHRVSF